MDISAIGKKIKELRKSIGLSQKELAKDICTQAQISKIESGDVLPLASTLYSISKRLGVDINYFFDLGTTPRLDYVQEVAAQLKLARRKLDYMMIKEIVESEERNPLFSTNRKNLQLLLWHKAIYSYHVHHESEQAHVLADQAIALTYDKVWSEREIEIRMSKGIFFYEEGKYQEAMDTYLQAKKDLEELIFLQDDTIHSRLLYNLAKAYTKIGNYQQSILLCEEAIRSCIEKDLLFLLGELHYHIGYNHELQEQFFLARKYMSQALNVFHIQKNANYNSFIGEKISRFDSICHTSP